MFLTPQFIFKADCERHDDYYQKAGGLLDKVYADVMFCALMLEDIRDGGYSFPRKYFYFVMAVLYFLVVSTLGWLPWWYNVIKNLWMRHK